MRNYVIQNSKKIITLKRTKAFEEHLKKASRIVEGWPEWKQQAVGAYRYSKRKGDDPAG